MIVLCLAVAVLLAITGLFLWAMQEEKRQAERSEEWRR